MKTKNFKFKSMALVLFALVLSSNVWGEEVILMNCSNFNPALKNNNYGDYNGKETDFTIGGGEIEFTGQDLNMNPNNTPTGFWKEQFLQMKKTSGHIQSKTALNLVSLKIVSFSKDFTVTAGTSLSALSEVTASETTQKTTINLYNSSDKTKPSGTQEEDLTVSTYNLSGKNYFKIANGSSSMSEIYSIEVTYSTGPSCTNTITITKGTETNGTFELSQTGEVCIDDGNATVNVTDITPAEHYHFSQITATNGTVDNVNKKVTNISANTTINVTFAEDSKVTVTFSDAIHDNNSNYMEYVGDKIQFPTITDAAKGDGCKGEHYHFVGWTKDASQPNALVTPASETAPATNITYYAVWAKEDE